MSDQVPLSIPDDGSLKVLWVPAITDTTAPTIDELTAAEVVDLSCYLTADGWAPATEEGVSTDDRLCTRQTFEKRGRVGESLEITYVYQAQDLAALDNLAYATLLEDETGYVVARYGDDYEVAIEVADLVDIRPGTCGIQRKSIPEANGRQRVMQKIFIDNKVRRSVAVVAS